MSRSIFVLGGGPMGYDDYFEIASFEVPGTFEGAWHLGS
jgi:hypothetical protein